MGQLKMDIHGNEVGTAALSGAHRNGPAAAAVRGVQRDTDRTIESVRRRREATKPLSLDPKSRPLSRVLVGERERRLYLLAPGEIDYIESRGNYVEFHADDLVFISRDSIKRLSRVLADSGYLRIQRTLLLNLSCIVYAQRVGHGNFAFTLTSGARLCSGAKYREEILGILPLTRARRRGGVESARSQELPPRGPRNALGGRRSQRNQTLRSC